MSQAFPLLAVGLIVYGVLTFTGVLDQGETAWVDLLLLNPTLASGDVWEITAGDFFLLANLGLLFVEIVRATKTDTSAIINHGFSFLLFVGALLGFIFLDGFGNSTFFVYMAMTFLDPMAGIVVTTVTARRDLNVTDQIAR